MRLGDISVAYVELLCKALEANGYTAENLLAEYGLDSARIQAPYARISIPRFMRLGHRAIELSNTPWLGLEMGRLSHAPVMGLAGLLAQSAADIRTACKMLAKYELLSTFNSRGRSRFVLSKDSARLQFYSISPYNAYNYFVVDSVLAGWWQLVKTLSGNKINLVAVEFEFSAPTYIDKYRQYFPVEVKFSQPRNALVFAREQLALPVVSASASTHASLLALAEKELAKVKLGLTVREQTERAISPLLNGHTPSLEEVAQQLNSTPWRLRRQLSAEGYSFQQVLNETRRDLAISYVKDTKLSLGEIAYLLGFGSAVAFQRAFKRWTAEAPGRYREQKNN